MVLKVDLKCDCCYKRVRKALCGFPEIRDWIFDENENTVTITVDCCDPERLRYKLCNKGRGSIKSIKIKQIEEPGPVAKSQPEPPKEKEVTTAAPAAKPAEKPPPSPAPKPVEEPPKPETKAPEPAQKVAQPAEPSQKPVEPVPVVGSVPVPMCCWHGGGVVGPFNYGHGVPSVYFEGYCYGRIGFNGFGPSGPNRCHHPKPQGGSFGHFNG
ncbi:unnamed protein product [Rhodiola kirilowii]